VTVDGPPSGKEEIDQISEVMNFKYHLQVTLFAELCLSKAYLP
jgi:hypothetical protein